MLHPGQGFRRCDYSPQTIVVKFVRGGASRASAENCAHGDNVVLFLDVLVDGVVGKASEGKTSAGKKNFDLVSGREPSDSIKDVGGLVLSQHAAISNWQLAVGGEAIDAYLLKQRC